MNDRGSHLIATMIQLLAIVAIIGIVHLVALDRQDGDPVRDNATGTIHVTSPHGNTSGR